MSEARQVAAAIEIVGAMRGAVADAMKVHDEERWHRQVLVFETARMLGLMLRNEEVTPSQLDDVIGFLRRVYAGVFPTGLMSVEDAVQQFCSGPESDSSTPCSGDGAGPATLH